MLLELFVWFSVWVWCFWLFCLLFIVFVDLLLCDYVRYLFTRMFYLPTLVCWLEFGLLFVDVTLVCCACLLCCVLGLNLLVGVCFVRCCLDCVTVFVCCCDFIS